MSSSQSLSVNSHNLPILVVLIALCCFVTILIVVLLIMCIKFRRRKISISGSHLEQTTTSESSEASKFYMVESSAERKRESEVTSPLNTHTSPVLSLTPLSRNVVIDMESNPLYHQLKTEGEGGRRSQIDSPFDSKESSRHTSYQSNESSSSNPLPPQIIVTSDNITDNVFTSQPIKSHSVSHHTYRNSEVPYNNNSNSSNNNLEDNFVRTLSDNHLDMTRGNGGPLYNQVQFYSTKALNILEIKPDNIITMGTLGMGQFGQVHLAHTHNLSATELGLGEDFDRSKTHKVAVKFLNENTTQRDLKAFQKEVKYMSQLQHENVVQILAVCWEGKNFIVLEFMKNGDLQSFLQRYKTVNMGQETYGTTVSHNKLVNISLQISDAMRFLSSKNYIHRDLACRNCLVGENFNIKVGDFGLSKNLYDSCYYRFQGSAMLPIRWMAPESFYGRFSEKTDVWSFGVTMWEIFNLCKEHPYPGLSDQEIVQESLKKRLPCLNRPDCCTLAVYQVMETCLRVSSSERADFESVYLQLNALSH